MRPSTGRTRRSRRCHGRVRVVPAQALVDLAGVLGEVAADEVGELTQVGADRVAEAGLVTLERSLTLEVGERPPAFVGRDLESTLDLQSVVRGQPVWRKRNRLRDADGTSSA